MTATIWLFVIVSTVVHMKGEADRVKDLIYYESGAINMCFRRLDTNRQIGCSSKRGGNVGVLHHIETEEDITWLVDHGPHQPYVVIMDAATLTRDVFKSLNDSGKINGLLLIKSVNESTMPDIFSPDTPCPNSHYDLYQDNEEYKSCKKNKWNPNGNGLLMQDIDFPIIIMGNLTAVDFFINECYKPYNEPIDGAARDYPLCGAEVKAPMDAIKDTPTCLRRGQPRNFNPQSVCDPLADENVYSFLNPIPFEHAAPDVLKNRSVIVASAKLDVAGMFEREYPASESTVVGFVSLLAAAEALGKVKDTITAEDKHIMFSFLQGESFDYIGSSRLLYDMSRGQFPGEVPEGSAGPHPVWPHHLHSVLELTQVGLPQEQTMWIHSDPLSRKKGEIDTQVESMEQVMSRHGRDTGLDLKNTDSDLPLPPASLHTFLKHESLPGVVLADHHKHYNNKYYNSRFDTPLTVNYTLSSNVSINESQYTETPLSRHLTRVATTVARSLYEMSTGRNYTGGTIQADPTTVTKLLACFFVSPQCELFNLTGKKGEPFQKAPYELYVGIDRSPTSGVTVHTYRLLAYYTGDVMTNANSSDDCDKLQSPYHTYVWMQGPVNTSSPDQSREGLCIQTTANFSAAKSPAFEDGYDFASGKYPAWTESIWGTNMPSLRVFLLPDHNYEIMTLCVGIAVAAVSLPLVFIFHKRSPLVFHTEL